MADSKQRFFFLIGLWAITIPVFTQQSNHGHKFEQITDLLPDPNTYRGVDGAPGPDYWQQRCDYQIDCRLDVENRRLFGSEIITYHNQSPNTLNYLWLQHPERDCCNT